MSRAQHLPHVLITGASGFVGRALLAALHGQGYPLTAASRQAPPQQGASLRYWPVQRLDGHSDWRGALQGVDVVVHCAARVHVMNERGADPLAAFRQANVEATLALARQAQAAGVRRFIFLSSIKAHGEASRPGRPLRADDPPAPCDPYGQSKLEAEWALQALAAETGLELVIIRPVLVYGPGVRANFRSLLRAVARGWPLPLGALGNRRSLLALDNLVDLIRVCLTHPAAAGATLLASDGEDLSPRELVRRLARALERPPRLLPVPAGLLTALLVLLGRRGVAERLCGTLQVDISATCRRLNWQPPVTVDTALQRTVRDYLEHS